MSNKVGFRLRELRQMSGYTQQEVADMLGLKNKSTLGSWEIGKSEPHANTFLKLCRIYGVTDVLAEFGQSSAHSIILNQAELELITHYRELTPNQQDYLLETARLFELANEERRKKRYDRQRPYNQSNDQQPDFQETPPWEPGEPDFQPPNIQPPPDIE